MTDVELKFDEHKWTAEMKKKKNAQEYLESAIFNVKEWLIINVTLKNKFKC